jgi:hypothetical protein
VKTPNNYLIYFRFPEASPFSDYGQLDADTAVMGPEKIFWLGIYTPPSGTYLICFNAYGVSDYPSNFVPAPSTTNPVDFSVTVSIPGSPDQIFTGSRTFQSTSEECTALSPTYVTSVTYGPPG